MEFRAARFSTAMFRGRRSRFVHCTDEGQGGARRAFLKRLRRPGLALGVAVSVSMGAVAFASSATLQRSADAALADRICVGVMGLEGGTVQHDVCIKSLEASDRAMRQASALSQARDICGKSAGGAGYDLARCEMETAEKLQASAPVSAADMTSLPQKTTSYFHTTPDEDWQREKLSCAALGLRPATGPYDDCVADLRASLTRFMSSGFQGG